MKFGQKISTTQSYISRLENGNLNLSMRMIKSISEALKISTDYLLFDEKTEQNI